MAKKIDLNGLDHFKEKENASIAIAEATSTASAPHKAGEYFYYKGDLVIATADIAQGDTITLNTNCKKQPLADSVCELKTALSEETTVYTPFDDVDNFKCYNDFANREFVNGIDMFVFSNYHLDAENRAIIWYSIDQGHTYKIAYEFNVTSEFNSIKHVHGILYCPSQGTHLVMTGDSNATECMIFELKYTSGTDSWAITQLAGSARAYKWTCAAIWNDEIYYTQDNTPGGVYKCKYEDIADLTKHTQILSGTDTDPRHIAIGPRGDMVVTMCHNRNTAGQTVPMLLTLEEETRKIYYSANRKDFDEIFMPVRLLYGSQELCYLKPVTADGHVIVGTYLPGMLPSIYLDDYIRASGHTHAFLPPL